MEGGGSLQGVVFAFFMALVATVGYSEFKPYLFSEDDVLQLCCQLAIFCTAFSGLLIKTKVRETDGYNESAFSWFLGE